MNQSEVVVFAALHSAKKSIGCRKINVTCSATIFILFLRKNKKSINI
jgi:hypothetical protein